MAEEKKKKVESGTTVKLENGTVVNGAPVSMARAPQAGDSKLTFEHYCSIRGVPLLEQAGKRAFARTNNKKLATMKEWDGLFKTY